MSTDPGPVSTAMPERIGKYEIRAELGRGGFGQVYLGFDPTVSRQVAVKVLSSDGDPVTLRRFRTEASSAGNLRHKNIVTIHELGDDHGTFYIAMEYLQGRDLQRVIASPNHLSLPDKMRIMSQAAEGLLCAHQHGIVHRDVKPGNIMVLDDGSVKLMDFGIARLTRDGSTRLTQTGFLVGTAFYMAPEQLDNQEADARCDIWSFGAIYYELLTGRHPFEAPDVSSAILRIVQHEPSPIELVCPDCPSALAAVIARLLSKDRDARYQNFEDVLFDTAPILLDLESQQAKQLIGQAKGFLQKGNLEEAQSLVKRVLARDPSHEQGRALWQQLQAELRRRAIVVRTRTLIEQSEKAAAAGDYSTAIGALETAVRIDPADTSLPVRLGELRAAKQRADLAARLMFSACENLQQNHLSTAFQLLSDALRAQPSNAEAQRLISDVQNRIAERETQKRINDGLAKVKGLLTLESFDEAMRILEDLSRQAPASDQVRAALELARQQRQEYERKRAIQSALEAARNEIKAKEFEAAVSRLERIASQYPGQNDVASLLSYARGEWEAAQHMARIRAAAAAAWKLLKAQQYDQALVEVDASLVKYKNEPALMRLRQSILSERAEDERKRFVQQTLADSAELERKGNAEQACATLEKALQRYKSEAALAEALVGMRQKAAQQRQERERAAALERDLQQADTFNAQGQFRQAIELLTRMQSSYPDEARVVSLLNRAQEEERRRAALEALRAEAQGYLEAGETEKACEAVARGRKEFGADPQLIAVGAAAERVRELKELAEQERIRFVKQTLTDSAEMERSGQLEQGCATLEKALNRYDSEPSLSEAFAHLRQKLLEQQEQERERQKKLLEQQEQERAAKLERERQQLLEQQEQERAAKVERERQEKLLAQQEQERAAKVERERQEKLLAQQEQERAAKVERERQEKLLAQQEQERATKVERERQEKLLAQQEQERAAKVERERQEKLLAQQEQERAAKRERELRQADTLAEPGQPGPAALPQAQPSPSYPAETRSFSLLDRTQEEQRRRADMDALCVQIQRFLVAGQLDKAGELVARGQREFPPDPKLITLKAATERMRVRKDALDRARTAIQKRDWRVAADSLESVLRQDAKDIEARRLLDQILEQERSDRHPGRVEKGRMEAERLMRNLQFQEAARLLRALQAEFPDERAIGDDLRAALDAIDRQSRRETYIQGRNRADALVRIGQYQAAVNILEELTVQYPGDAVLKQELNSARQFLLEYSRRERYASGRRQAVELVQARNFKDAITLLESLLADFAGDPALQEDLKALRGARESQERSERIDREVAQLEKLYRKGDARALRERAAALPADLVDARIRALLDWAGSELERQGAESPQQQNTGTIWARLSADAKDWRGFWQRLSSRTKR